MSFCGLNKIMYIYVKYLVYCLLYCKLQIIMLFYYILFS